MNECRLRFRKTCSVEEQGKDGNRERECISECLTVESGAGRMQHVRVGHGMRFGERCAGRQRAGAARNHGSQYSDRLRDSQGVSLIKLVEECTAQNDDALCPGMRAAWYASTRELE